MVVKQSTQLSNIHLSPEYLAFFWRGHCLNHFSRAEVAIADCIEAIRESGGDLDAESKHPGAAARSRSLAAALKSQSYGGHEKVAIRRLGEWDQLSLERAALAHGLFAFEQNGVTISLTEYLSGGRRDQPSRFYSPEDMRSFLAKLETCVHNLAVQLGQIEALCRKHVD